MRVDLGSSNVLVSELLLHRADVHPPLQEVCREGVTERVAACRFVDAGPANCIPDGLLHRALIDVMAPLPP